MGLWRNQRGNGKLPGDRGKQRHKNPTFVGYSKSSPKRKIYSSTSLPQETRKTSNKLSNLILQELEKEHTTAKGSRRKKIAKINGDKWNRK